MLQKKKKTMKFWDVNVDNIVVSKLVETKISSEYLTGIKFDKNYETISFDNA